MGPRRSRRVHAQPQAARAGDAKHLHLKYGEYGDVSLNAIHATGGDSFFVVITVQKGAPPEVRTDGTGLDAVVTVGERRLSFDGEKIILTT